MANIPAANSTLIQIQNKARLITHSLNESQLTTANLNQYINTFVLYDLPQRIKLFSLRTTLTFYTQPNIELYKTNDIPNDPLNNFSNLYTAVHEPLYIAGVRASYTQNRDVYYGNYPQTNFIQNTGIVGDNTTGPFMGTLTSVPILQNNVLFSINNTDGTAMNMVDVPLINIDLSTSTTTGLLYQANDLPSTNPAAPVFGNINYITGAFTINFPANTQTNAILYASTIPYQTGIPTMMLFYNQEFKVWPVPNQAYAVQMDCDVLPTAFLATTDTPLINQWWQYIAYGASIKIFEDRLDVDSMEKIIPTFKEQEALVERSTTDLRVNQRTQTIYVANGNRNGFGLWQFGRWPY